MEADAYVLVSGEYNESIPPALTNMMDHFPPKAYAFKPCALVTYSVSESPCAGIEQVGHTQVLHTPAHTPRSAAPACP